MDPLRWKKIKSTFEDVVAKPESERELFLDQTCANDSDLKTEVSSLLDYHTKADRFLEPPQSSLAGQPDPHIGRLFGSYRTDSVLGHGGMGAVYKAVRDDGQFQKQVAIKLVRPGVWSKELALRFHEERRTLARLEHPNIASLFDGGTTEDGVPYLVMEYVNGKPINEYCDAAKLSIVERLRLFRTVCSAVQYAHQNLVVHRDIKPGNILVTPEGIPKLLDFGIAKFISEQEHAEPGEMTRVGLRFVTYEYASPEQIRGATITTTSDVYSLGILLYKVLTGHRPYQFKSRLPHEITRIVCEQEPRKPSATVLKAADNEDEPEATRTTSPEEISSLRASSPHKLHRHLVGDLDNIVLKALQKDPHRRYATVEQFSEDIRRHLEGLPVTARQDTIVYRGTKFLKRHMVGVAATAVVFVALAGGIIGVLWQANRAKQEAAKAEQINAFLQEMLSSADPARSGKDVTVARTLDQAVVRVNQELLAQPEIAAAVLHTIGETYIALGLYDKASVQLERSLEIRHEVLGAEHEDISNSLHSLAYIAQVTRDFAKADSLYQRAIMMHNKVQPDPDKHLAVMMTDWGSLLRDRRETDRALSVLKESVEMHRTLFGKESREYASALITLGPALQDNHELAAAESVYRTALDIRKRLAGDEHVDVGFALNNLAFVLTEKGDPEGAEAMFRRSLAIWRKALGNEHPQVESGLLNLAGILQKRGKLDEAQKLLMDALALNRKQAVPDPLRLSAIEHLLGRNMNLKGDPAEAEPYLRETVTLRRKLFPPGHYVVAIAESELGRSLTMLKRYPEAEVALSNAYKSLSLEFGDSSARTQETLRSLAELYVKWGKREQARAYEAKLVQSKHPQPSSH
jgi:eukaryotic-like serine/threonine-protein kinase